MIKCQKFENISFLRVRESKRETQYIKKELSCRVGHRNKEQTDSDQRGGGRVVRRERR